MFSGVGVIAGLGIGLLISGIALVALFSAYTGEPGYPPAWAFLLALLAPPLAAALAGASLGWAIGERPSVQSTRRIGIAIVLALAVVCAMIFGPDLWWFSSVLVPD